MKVTLQFRGPLTKKFQEGAIEIELESGATLSDLLSKAIEREECVREVWDSPEVIDRDALVLCNEADIGLSGGLDTELNESDVIVVLPLIHGG
ncbi:MAG: MoaD/ThiS family protein [Candidatus Thorarchaeota archaeon]|jgi:molybdopterin converting factor small subunit|nr:MoaD/ThiS family protein [Candidatus Thorarchaeota archaeon]